MEGDYMTIVASWFEDDFAWMVSDSRLSNTDGNSTYPILDCGAKIFKVPIIVKAPVKTFDRKIIWKQEIGVAFAGSSLIALNVYSIISYVLPHLLNIPGCCPRVSIRDIAEYIGRVIKHMVCDYGYNTGTSAHCVLFVLGKCYKENKYKLFKIIPVYDAHVDINVEDLDLYKNKAVYLIGDHTHEIEKSIQDAYRNNTYLNQIPLKIVKKIIVDNCFETIGGGIQLGMARELEFHKLLVTGKNENQHDTLYYQNIDFLSDDFRQIGSCMIDGIGYQVFD